ncbi:3-carboxy-cis,cis-muconate cycloisomerase [Streptomyces zagrosensis]|uniref:3-carboxy-cis,cis-muconate cycloisomerase n=1 Tax=Streptomyces zagrosensis TaxID=1042984 RepID=A0A7W9QBQ3_9ACTN|nr:3-carboxy-cis,cis-muconate cycloisomerase [Streptomyces zagrosensis]MBB5936969.1 3-carboxy-cis,cis-muconate cycloisomerase [Streptomyces zagrosensis]
MSDQRAAGRAGAVGDGHFPASEPVPDLPDREQAADRERTASSVQAAQAAHWHADSGLLSPVRAGTPVEAAVADHAWLQAMLDAEAALARAQARLGTVPHEAARVITDAAQARHLDLFALARRAREAANPVVALVQEFSAVVAARDASAAEYVHRGSTSQDILDTGAMLVADRALGLIIPDLDRTAEALATLAERHRDTTMAGRTLTLHAVPTTFGLKAAGWMWLVLDAAERLRRVRDGLPVQLGGAAGTLAGYLEYAGCGHGSPRVGSYAQELTAAFADEAGLAQPVLPWHALRTPMVDLAAALAFTAGALGKVAVDVQSLTRTEVGEVHEGTVAGRGASSAMPHKRNPVLATVIRSAALQVPQLAATVTGAMAAEDERSAGVWHAEWEPLRECLRLAGGAAAHAVELTENLSVATDRMRANLGLTGGQLVSERVAVALAPLLGKAVAKDVLSRASADAAGSGRPLGTILGELPEVTRHLTAAQIADLVEPTSYTGAAGVLVDRALTRPRQGRWQEVVMAPDGEESQD